MEMKTPEGRIELLRNALVEQGREIEDSVDDLSAHILGHLPDRRDIREAGTR